jgi:hypothetical protein
MALDYPGHEYPGHPGREYPTGSRVSGSQIYGSWISRLRISIIRVTDIRVIQGCQLNKPSAESIYRPTPRHLSVLIHSDELKITYVRGTPVTSPIPGYPGHAYPSLGYPGPREKGLRTASFLKVN